MAPGHLPRWARLLIGGALTGLFVLYGAMGAVMWLVVASVETAIRGQGSRLQLAWHHIFESTPLLLCGAALGLALGLLWSTRVLKRTGYAGDERLPLRFLRFLGAGALWGLVAGVLYTVVGYLALVALLGWSLVGAIFGVLYPPAGGLVAGVIGGVAAGLVSCCCSPERPPGPATPD